MFEINNHNDNSTTLQQQQQQHQLRISEYVERTIPNHALKNGTNVMVMETSCNTPGCVPLETSILILFPKHDHDSDNDSNQYEYIPGLPQSTSGGSFQTKILLPLSEVTFDDVLNSLPPCFLGGRRRRKQTLGTIGIEMRDLLFCKLDQTQEMEDRKLIAEYLIASLQEYVANGCQYDDVTISSSYSGIKIVENNEQQKNESSSESTITCTETTTVTTTTNVNHSNNHNTSKEDDSNKHHNNINNITYTDIISNNNNNNVRSNKQKQQSSSITFELLPNSSTIMQQLASRDSSVIAACSRNSSCPCCDQGNLQDLKLETSMLS